MSLKLGFVMDPIAQIQFHKDSTLAMMLAAQTRAHTLYYIEPKNLYSEHGKAFATAYPIRVLNDAANWAQLGPLENLSLESLDCIFMRQDPPFNMNYIYVTYFLELAEQTGVLIVNSPAGVRDCNEKFYTTRFPELTAPTCVASNPIILKNFIREYQDCIVKPLDGMGGASVFRLKAGDQNTNVILESITDYATRPCMIQQYLPEIAQGDKRILVFKGEPVEHVVVRTPSQDDFRGNIAAGATTHVRPITESERALVAKIGPELVKKGLYIVGLDVIGDKISEINNTSPTCFRQIEEATAEKVSEKCIEMVESLISDVE